jgi:hypothetical protein
MLVRHDPILVGAAKFGDHHWNIYWRYWCPCGKGGSVQTYEEASKSALAHADAKNTKIP